MSEYFRLEPVGVGTAEVESFTSYCCRLAQIHSLSTFTFVKHLNRWWARQPHCSEKQPTFDVISPWLNGYSPSAEHVRQVVENATGMHAVSQLSFSKLSAAGPRNSFGLVRKHRAWCPACLEEDLRRDGFCYERLLWLLPNITRCPYHKLMLHNCCPTCGETQRNYHATGDVGICWKCNGDLRCITEARIYRSTPSLCEKQCSELVEAISDGSLIVTEDAFQIFAKHIRAQLGAKRRSYAKIFGSTYCKHIRREQMRPSFRMMLQQSHALGVSLVQILGDPEAAASAAGTLALAEQIRMDIRRERLSAQKIEEIEARLRHGVECAAGSDLVSLRALSRELEVSTGAIEGRFGPLVRMYQTKRKSAVAAARLQAQANILAALDDGLLRDYEDRRIRTIDELAFRTSQAAGVGVRVARLGIAARLKPNH